MEKQMRIFHVIIVLSGCLLGAWACGKIDIDFESSDGSFGTSTSTEIETGRHRRQRRSPAATPGSGMEGHLTCEASELMAGFRRAARRSPDTIDGLTMTACLKPRRETKLQSLINDWGQSFAANDRWSRCPRGYFLQGLHFFGFGKLLGDIREGRCVKYADLADDYGRCYDQTTSFDFAHSTTCMEGYYVTALYRGGCNELFCFEKIRCCQLAPMTS